MTDQDIYIEAMNHTDADERDAFLAEACGDDRPLRNRIDRLIRHHDQAGSFLEHPLEPEAVATLDMPSAIERPGTQIGPYKLREQIGEGGFGVVYVAQQSKPVRRKVALKIIKPGMDTRDVIARFEAERQALALMDHPNIAKVLDAGTTGENPKSEIRNPKEIRSKKSECQNRPDVGGLEIRNSNLELPSDFAAVEFEQGRDSNFRPEGRPYFVMELVRGVPITEFCDERKLNTRERLQLFIDVCRAVQHAHQKGIIHRDLKPSNILVTLDDGRPIPKVIDFGIAKALSQQLTEHSIYTAYGQMIGTPLYMAPEQAEMSMRDVDTRSDVYSLGVLLYELLTGTTPFDKDTLQKSGFEEMRRIIREVDPPRPSARISTLRAELLSTVSDKRKVDPRRLSASLRGELDWIVMKALEKDRNRRYESASAFAADVERFLADEPVQARPASVGYRLRKFVRRNRTRLAVVAISLFFLILSGSIAGWAWRDRAARAHEHEMEQIAREADAVRQQSERQAKVAGQVELILQEADRLMRKQKWLEALRVASRAEAAVAGGEADSATAQLVRALLKDLRFIDRLEQIRVEKATLVEGQFNHAGADRDYARAFRDYGVDVEALAVETSIDRLKARPALAIPLAAALDDWVTARRHLSQMDVADWKRLLTVARGVDPDPLRDRLRATWGKPVSEVQVELLRLAESIDTRTLHPATLFRLALALKRAKHSDSALRLLRGAQYAHPGDFWLNFELGSALHKQKDHEGAIRFYTAAVSIRPHSAAAHHNLGVALLGQKKVDEAVAAFRKAIELDSKYATAYTGLGNALRDQQKLEEAIAAHRKAIELDPTCANAYSNLGATLCDQKKPDEAVTAIRKAIELDPRFALAHHNLGVSLRNQGKLDEAVASYHKAIELDPKLAASYCDLGTTLSDQNKLDEAIIAYRKAIELVPVDSAVPVIYYNLGNALYKQKKLDEGIAAYRKAIKLASARVNSVVYARHKRTSGSGRTQVRATRVNWVGYARHNLAVALANQAWLLATSPDPAVRNSKAALRVASEAIKTKRRLAPAWNALGVAHYHERDWKAAVAALEEAHRIDQTTDKYVLSKPEDRCAAQFVRAMCYWQLGRKQDARAWYDRAARRTERRRRKSAELRRFRAEAERLMGIQRGTSTAGARKPAGRKPVVARKPKRN